MLNYFQDFTNGLRNSSTYRINNKFYVMDATLEQFKSCIWIQLQPNLFVINNLDTYLSRTQNNFGFNTFGFHNRDSWFGLQFKKYLE